MFTLTLTLTLKDDPDAVISLRDMARSKSVRAPVPKQHLTHSKLMRIDIEASDRRTERTSRRTGETETPSAQTGQT